MTRRALVTAAVLVALGLTAPPVTRAAGGTTGWRDARGLAASPDGNFLYGAGAPVATFRRDARGGELTSLGTERVNGSALAPSPDGRFVYVLDQSQILILARDGASGRLTYLRSFGDVDAPISTGRQLVVSHDGGQLYVLSGRENAITVLGRDRASGGLSVAQVIWGGAGGVPALQSPSAFALTADDRHLYVANDDTEPNQGGVTNHASVGILARDAATGVLTSVGSAPRPGPVKAVGVSPDGRWVYGGVGDFSAWSRDAVSGGLTESYDMNPSRGCTDDRCAYAGAMAVSPDGALLAITRPQSGSVDVWRLAGDAVLGEQVLADGREGTAGVATPLGVLWSPDGRQLYVLGATSSTAGSVDGGVVTFGRTPGTDQLSYRAATRPRFGPFATGPIAPSVSIDGGATYTNDPRVELTVHWPVAASLTIANEPDLAPSRVVRVDGDDGRYRWRLGASLLRDRSVRRVYVQGNPFYEEGHTVSDDIVLDQRPPEILGGQILPITAGASAGARASAARRRPTRVRLVLRARDNRSKVRGVQIAAHRRRPGRVRRFAPRLTLTTASRLLFVRVRDGAGNWSRWRAIRRRAGGHPR